MQGQVELARSTQAEARRLGRIPQVILAVSVAGLIGGAAYHSEQALHDQAQHILASGTVQPGTHRYRDLETAASNVSNRILEGGTEGGALVAGVFTGLTVSDRLARPRARLIVARAKRKAS
jgi:hypothetical protein